ncbi:hypothetical protein LZ32DRAFT_61080 [Colletotrichum eremochloae]|nr:hypothetical protein LZ32DRAFT_61080 [Colletotrichum eremochloae]
MGKNETGLAMLAWYSTKARRWMIFRASHNRTRENEESPTTWNRKRKRNQSPDGQQLCSGILTNKPTTLFPFTVLPSPPELEHIPPISDMPFFPLYHLPPPFSFLHLMTRLCQVSLVVGHGSLACYPAPTAQGRLEPS